MSTPWKSNSPGWALCATHGHGDMFCALRRWRMIVDVLPPMLLKVDASRGIAAPPNAGSIVIRISPLAGAVFPV